MPIRHAAVAGQFYPARPDELRAEVAACERQAARVFASPAPAEASHPSDPAHPWTWTKPLLTMLPHAGHVFCGPVIAAALAGVSLPRRLIVLAPSHTGQGHPLGFWPDGVWETPLGNVPVDAELGHELEALGGGFAPDTRPHLREHDIEVLLPFLLTVRPDLTLLPIVVGQPEGLAEAAHALAALVAAHVGEAAFILSSDMNHYADDVENRRLDRLALDAFLSLEPRRLLRVVRDWRISMCGVLPALMGLMACGELGAKHARLAAYDTSATASGDASRVVGYAGVRVW